MSAYFQWFFIYTWCSNSKCNKCGKMLIAKSNQIEKFLPLWCRFWFPAWWKKYTVSAFQPTTFEECKSYTLYSHSWPFQSDKKVWVPKGVFTCSVLASIVTILVSIVVILTSIDPILEKCGHLQVQYSQVFGQIIWSE